MQKRMFRAGLVFVIPITSIMFIFMFLPIFKSLYYSLTDWQGIGDYKFVGLKNYMDILDDPGFISSLKLTLVLGFSAAILANLIGLFLAVLLDQSLRLKKIWRALFYLPNVIPTVVAAFVWRYILDVNNGLINTLLSEITGKHIRIPWIDSPHYVLNSIILITIWHMMGPIIIIYIAALQGVPHDLQEAAMIDGASKWKRFIRITVPMIAPGITVNVLLGLSNSIRVFDLPFALTGGGPASSSETLAIRIYEYAYQSSNMGYGTAASFVLTLVALIVTFFFVAISRQYEKGVQ